MSATLLLGNTLSFYDTEKSKEFYFRSDKSILEAKNLGDLACQIFVWPSRFTFDNQKVFNWLTEKELYYHIIFEQFYNMFIQ